MQPQPDAALRVFELHRDWMAKQAADPDVPFRPEDWPAASSVYNQMYPDIEADDEAYHDAARKVLGLPPLEAA